MITEIIARLQAAVPALKLVEGAAGFQVASAANPKASPAAFVFPVSATGGPTLTYSRVEQRVDALVAVVYAVRNVADAAGDAARADMEALRSAALSVLLGWSPPGCDALTYASGQLLAFRDGWMWWQDVYATKFDITQET